MTTINLHGLLPAAPPRPAVTPRPVILRVNGLRGLAVDYCPFGLTGGADFWVVLDGETSGAWIPAEMVRAA